MTPKATSADVPQPVFRTWAFLHEHLDRNITLAELTEMTGWTKTRLVRAFSRQYGLPPHALHLRLRLERARELLGEGQRPADVAHATGFFDQAHLTRLFRRLFGETPGSYRTAALESRSTYPVVDVRDRQRQWS